MFLFNFITGLRFASVGYKNSAPGYRRKQQWKILFHILLNPSFAHTWFALIKSPNFHQIYSCRPRIYIKPFRPYISTKWKKEHKVKVILDTYRFWKKNNLFNELPKESICFPKISLDNNYNGILELGYDEKFRKEGEFVLTFGLDGMVEKIIAVAFSFEETEANTWTCWVGCVQGCSNKDDFKLAQKLLYGMRPSAFIIFSLQELARYLSCEKILCAGNAIQANNKKHFIHINSIHKIHFDYDNFYKEVGGIKISKDWYQLPLTFTENDLASVKSNKRNMYRKRYKLLNDLSASIKTYMDNISQLEGISTVPT